MGLLQPRGVQPGVERAVGREDGGRRHDAVGRQLSGGRHRATATYRLQLRHQGVIMCTCQRMTRLQHVFWEMPASGSYGMLTHM